MVLVWTAVSYIPSGSIPKGIPRRLLSPNPWSTGAYENWTVMKASFTFLILVYLILLFLIPKYCVNTNSLCTKLTGYAKCAGSLCNWSFCSSYNDCSALLFWPQCSISTCSAEGIQFEKTAFFPLWFTAFRIHGTTTSLFDVHHYRMIKKNCFVKYLNHVMVWQVILCGLIGIPPSNGVIPQSPMHTKSLATLKHQVCIYILWA